MKRSKALFAFAVIIVTLFCGLQITPAISESIVSLFLPALDFLAGLLKKEWTVCLWMAAAAAVYLLIFVIRRIRHRQPKKRKETLIG